MNILGLISQLIGIKILRLTNWNDSIHRYLFFCTLYITKLGNYNWTLVEEPLHKLPHIDKQRRKLGNPHPTRDLSSLQSFAFYIV